MITYSEMKSKLGSQDSKYFTKSFYETFLRERQESFNYFCEHGTWGKLEESEKSDFYIKNSCGWCKMIELFYCGLQKYRVDFLVGSYPFYDLIERQYVYYEKETDAKKWANAYKQDCFIEVMLVA